MLFPLVASWVPWPLSPIPLGISISYFWHFSGCTWVAAFLGLVVGAARREAHVAGQSWAWWSCRGCCRVAVSSLHEI